MTGLWPKRALVNTVFLVQCVGVWCTGCTYGAGQATVDPLDAAFPNAEWKTIPLSELVGSEGEFKDKRIKLFFENGRCKECVVERIDSTFAYTWYQMEHMPRRLAKTRLEDVTKAELYVSATEKAKWYHWSLTAIIIVVALTIGVIIAIYQGAAGAF